MMTITIAIISGGIARVSILAQLTEKYITEKLRFSGHKIQFLVIEKAGTIEESLICGTDDKFHILNSNAEKMSPISTDPKHFINWVKSNPNKWRSHFPTLDIDKCSYLPRKLFQLYLADLTITTQQRAKENGIIVKFIEDEALDIQIKTTSIINTKFEILLASCNGAMRVIAEQVILSFNHLPPTNFREFISKPNYFHSPWPVQPLLTKIPKQVKILIAGSRLTAIDIALAFASDGHTGTITMLSRYGWLPYVIGTSKPYVKQHLTLEAINEITANGTQPLPLNTLLELFQKEIESAEGKPLDINKLLTAKPTRSAKAWLKKEINRAENEVRPWQSVLGSLYPIVPNIWNALTNEDKQEFINKYYSLWMAYLAAFPIENAKKILTLLEKGQLEVIGGLDSLNFNTQMQCYEATLKDGSVISADYLVNGTGAGHDVTKADSKLLENLLARKLITPHPLGGIEIDFVTLNVKKNTPEKQNIENFFVVGDVTWGACMATADLGQVGKEAKRVVNSSIDQLCKTVSLSSTNSEDKMQSALPETREHMLQFINTEIQVGITQFLMSMQKTLSKKYIPEFPNSDNSLGLSTESAQVQIPNKSELSLLH